MEEDKIYTYDRLSQFVDNYTEFVNEEKRVDPSSSSTPLKITTTIISKHRPMQLTVTPWADLVHHYLQT